MVTRLATVRIGTVQVGVAVEAVLQALPASGLTALPRRRGALCGVVEHGGRVVPVVDLARWVDVGAAPQAADGAARVLLLRDGARCIGLRVDAVGGLVEAGEGGARRLLHDEDPEEVFHTVVKARGTGETFNMLDTGRLAALALAWLDDEDGRAQAAPGAAPEAARGGPGGVGGTCAIAAGVLRVGDARIAVPVADLAEVLPYPALRSAGYGAVHCTWRGRILAVLARGIFGDADADAETEAETETEADAAGAARRGRKALLAVVERDGLALGLRVDAALGMAAIAAAPDAPPAAQGLARASHDPDGHAVLLLDVPTLLARFPEAALARPPLAQAAEGGQGRHGAGRVNEVAYIVFEADGMLATPIDVLEEILPRPPALGPTMAWRGKTVAVTDLRADTASNRGQVMIVRCGERHAACVVTHARLMVPPRGARLYRMGPGARAVEFMTVGEAADQASYRTVDLASLLG